MPGDQIDAYNLVENIKRVLVGLSEAVSKGEENADIKLADELNKFRLWFQQTVKWSAGMWQLTRWIICP